MHTSEVQLSLDNVIRKVESGEMNPESAKAIHDAAREKRCQWLAQIRLAEHRNTVVSIPALEPLLYTKAA